MVIYTFYPDHQKEWKLIDVSGSKYDGNLVEIEGVVSSGSGISSSGDARFRVHIFTLQAWNVKGEATTRQKLTVHRTIDPWTDDFFSDDSTEERDYFADIPGNSLVRLKVYLAEDRSRAIMESGEVMPLTEDSVYDQVAENLEPVEIDTETFGTLTFEESLDLFCGEIEWKDELIEVYFHTETSLDIAEGLKTAEEIWRSIDEWDRKAKRYAAQELLETKNESWLGEDEDGEEEQELTTEDFVSRLTLESLSFHPGGSYEFHYDDGDLFWGHSVQVWGNIEKGLTTALFQG